MNQFDLAGILRTYSEKCAKASNTNQLKTIIKELKEELDLRKIRLENNLLLNLIF